MPHCGCPALELATAFVGLSVEICSCSNSLEPALVIGFAPNGRLSSSAGEGGTICSSAGREAAELSARFSSVSNSKVCLQREQRNAGAAPLNTSSETL